jgi:FHS family glucose/mannose:H+ symporter-like MFS transporter
VHVRTAGKKISWSWLALAYVSLIAYGLADNSRGPVFPEFLKAFSLSDSQGSLLFLVASAAAVLVNSTAPFWRKKLSTHALMQVFAIFTSLGLFAMGFATSFYGTLTGAAIFGAAMGGSGLLANLIVSEAVPPSLQRRALSGLHSMYGISSLVAPLFVTMLYHHGSSWRGVFTWLGIGPLLVLGFSWFSDPPAKSPSIISNPGSADLQQRGPGLKLKLHFAMILSLYVSAEVLVSSRLVLFARREIGLSVESANDLLAIFFLGMFLGRLISALFHFPVRNISILMFSSLVTLALSCLGIIGSPVLLALTGFSMSVFYPCVVALINDELGEHAPAVIGACIAIQGIGLVALNFAVGAVSDHWGLRFAMWITPMATLIVLSLLLAHKLKKARSPV